MFDSERGEVPEWSIGPVSKTGVPLRVPWVRIPPSPPTLFFDETLIGRTPSCGCSYRWMVSTAAVEVFLRRYWLIEVLNEFRGPGDWRPVTWSGLDGSSQLGPRWCASGSGLFLQDGPRLVYLKHLEFLT